MTSPFKHPLLIRLAHALLHKAERSQGENAAVLKLDPKTLPELYATGTPDALAHIALLLETLTQTGWVALRAKKQLPFQTLADQAPALVLLDAEPLASWSGFRPEGPKWSRELVRQLAVPGLLTVPNLPALLDYLQRNPLAWFQNLPHTECAIALNQLAVTCKSGAPAYLREISARHFKGHSKILDNREELLRLLGAQDGQFLEAPVQLLVSLPPRALRPKEGHSFSVVLFVENLVSFERMANLRQAPWSDVALVYAAGFKGAAKRLRTRQGSSIYWRDPDIDTGATAFIDWLYAYDAPHESMGVYFYGDLDFAGMQILAQLRQIFPSCKAWQPGYGALLSLLTVAHGHTPASAAKEGQVDPGMTGCEYSDDVLLPFLRHSEQCVDQEAWPVIS